MTWQLTDKAGLLDFTGGDPYVRCEVRDDGIGLVGPAGWVAFSSNDGRAGAVAEIEQLDEAAGADLVRRVEALAAERGERLAWFATTDGITLPLAPPWQDGARWVWMSATEVAEPDERWTLVELDDDLDAAQINAFALPINPRFEGDPGQGRNRYWLGARDARGALIGCGTVHESDAGFGHLAGLVVAPQHRGQGLGRALVIGLSRRVLASDGLSTLSAYADNQRAIDVYRSVGYRLDHVFHSSFTEPRRPVVAHPEFE